MDWSIKIWEDRSSGDYKNTYFSYKDGCAQFFIHDFAGGMEYEFWVDLSQEDTVVLLKKLGLTGLNAKEVRPIVLEKIPNSQSKFKELCKSFGLNPKSGRYSRIE